MLWDVFTYIGTIAFAISGSLAACGARSQYNLIGFYVLGFATSFAGGVIRNILIAAPVSDVWKNQHLLVTALIAMTLLFVFPHKTMSQWKIWGDITDAIGLAAFAIQGALYAQSLHQPVSAVIVSAILTGVGGGIVRDLLVRKQPIVFKSDYYAFWALIPGVIIGFNLIHGSVSTYILFGAVIALRMLSLYFKWSFPKHLIAKQLFSKE
ncbi:trimeric intracellular cation channel family protein [Priestia filamentosa]|uniref:trimeric intracellular cation channel family protein n=1 Tax=Priestia filamentosa TaxID=1402861 RepID=UPI0005892856